MLTHSSPEKQQTLSSAFGWISPLGQIECLSPGESRMSFSMSSPPYHTAEDVETPISFVKLCDTLNSTISPSIFSPKENRGLKLLKKRDYYQRDLLLNDNFLLLNPSESSSSSDSVIKPEVQPVKTELIVTKTHSLRNLKKNASTPTSVSHPVITPDTTSHYKDTSITQTRKSSKHNIISPDIPIDTTARVLLPSSPASAVTCNCKKSKCLKLYCDCFATLSYCNSSSCNCVDCANNADHEVLRQEAIKVTKDRNAFAFRTKISQKQEHAAGCRCKNSHCLKKYCECFTGNAFCGNNCKCLSCLNYSGSSDLEQVRTSSATTNTNNNINSASLVVSKCERSPLKSPGLNCKGISSSIFFNNDHQFISGLKSPNNFLGLLSDSSGHSDDSSFMIEEKLSPMKTTSTNGYNKSSKKNRVKFASVPAIYPFFGDHLPSTTKIISLKVLDYLNSKDIYAMAQVNLIWSEVAFDDALWE